MSHTEPIRDPELVQALLSYYSKIGQYRNHVLVNLGVYTALRISDILKLGTNDVYNFKKQRVRSSITVNEKKTRKKKAIALHDNLVHALELYFQYATPNHPLIVNSLTGEPITRIHAYRIINEAAKAVQIPHKVSSHSLRKTFGYHAWQSGVSPVVIMEIYNHSSYAITKRYLGVSQEDQNVVYRGLLL